MYYLLENNEIIDSRLWENRGCLCVENNELKVIFDFYGIKKILGVCIKSSENILDLAINKDLIKVKGKIFEINAYTNNEFYINDLKRFVYKHEVTDLYKLQPNGDFKRHEVKK